MLVVNPNSSIDIPFVYRSGFNYVDPTEDIFVYIKRGYGTSGAIILGPLKYKISLISAATPSYTQTLSNSASLSRISQGSYVLSLLIPGNIFPDKYTIQISTTADGLLDAKEYYFQVLQVPEANDEVYSPLDKKIAVNKKSSYKKINSSTTNNIVLIGHTDAITPLSIYKIVSIQDAINVLRADFESPLLRGIFDAYASGARDIYIMSAGPMSEYVSDIEKRNTKIFSDTGATPNSFGNAYSYYELYFLRLESCYQLLRDYEFIDIIVPLEVSFVDVSNINFVKQLANHCDYVQTTTGEVQIGIIGSRSIETTSENVTYLNSVNFDIQSEIDENGFIISDTGKYIILIYGEAIFNHKQLQRSYSNSVSAALAGTLASTRVDFGLAKKRIPPALSIVGNGLSSAQQKILKNKKVNYIVHGNRSRRGSLYDVSISGDLTQSISENFSDASNVRLVAMIISEVQSLGINSIGKFSYDRLIRNVDALLNILKSSDIIRDYKFDAYADKLDRGKLYFTISVVSVRTLRSISFSVATGKGV